MVLLHKLLVGFLSTSSVSSFAVLESAKARSRTTISQVSMIDEEDSVSQARQMPVQVVSEMPPPLPDTKKNKYYFLRHGQSTANVASIISSDRSIAYTKTHGLTDLGYKQGRESAQPLLDHLEGNGAQPGEKVIFVSSPFARAKETAEACLDGLAEDDLKNRIETLGVKISKDIVMENRLMERFFGDLDGEPLYTYGYVWPKDYEDVTHTGYNVESVAAVCTRLREVFERCESEFFGCHLVWTSHADVLQIGQLYAANAPNVGAFSAYRFKNGEVRTMKSTPDSLPEPVPLELPEQIANSN